MLHEYSLPERSEVIKIEIMNIMKEITTWRRTIWGIDLNKAIVAILRPSARWIRRNGLNMRATLSTLTTEMSDCMTRPKQENTTIMKSNMFHYSRR